MKLEKNIPIELNSGHAIRIDSRMKSPHDESWFDETPYGFNENMQFNVTIWGADDNGPTYSQWPWDTIKMFVSGGGGRRKSTFHQYAQDQVFFTKT